MRKVIEDKNTMELLPCPFCGGEAKLVKHEKDFIIYMMIGCKICLASTSKFRIHIWADQLSMVCRETDAIKAWNTRAQSEKP